MKQEIFDDCLNRWLASDGHTEFWKELADKYFYPTAESLRQEFKYQRRKRGIKKEEQKVVVVPEQNKHNAKILLLDIETTPIQAFVWGLWDQNISIDAICQDWHILTWSAKWLFSDKIVSSSLTSEEAKKHNDKRVVEQLWNLLNESDIIITHNGDSFDLKRINTRFLFNGMKPPKPSQSIDTLKIARQVFDFSSNKLDYINQFLGLPKKEETNFQLWIDCFYGEEKALEKMEKYNRNDVEILEDTYLRMRPYIKGHPNLNLWSVENVSVCPNCASEKLEKTGLYYTYTGYYESFHCTNCGAHGRARKLETPKEKRKLIIR